MNKEELRNWAELPPELTSAVLSRLGPIDILENAQKVCKSWHRVCKDPWIWRKIVYMYNLKVLEETRNYDLEIMCCHAVDRSQGGLVEIDILYFATDELLNYIAYRSSNLRCLRLQMCCLVTSNGLVNGVTKLSFLEELEISYPYRKLDLKAIGHSCPLLNTLKLNRYASIRDIKYDDDEALAISETMPELRHLELSLNTLTNSGLDAILDKCLHLKHLDLRCCFNIKLVGDLERRCSERIKYLIRPDDQPTRNISMDDCVTMFTLLYEKVHPNGFRS